MWIYYFLGVVAVLLVIIVVVIILISVPPWSLTTDQRSFAVCMSAWVCVCVCVSNQIDTKTDAPLADVKLKRIWRQDLGITSLFCPGVSVTWILAEANFFCQDGVGKCLRSKVLWLVTTIQERNFIHVTLVTHKSKNPVNYNLVKTEIKAAITPPIYDWSFVYNAFYGPFWGELCKKYVLFLFAWCGLTRN